MTKTINRKTIAIANQKGGVGKTNITFNISDALAEEKKRILAQNKRYAEMGYTRQLDVDYDYTPASLGKYKIVLEVNGKKLAKSASILQDHWYNK